MNQTRQPEFTLSVVIPVYNEEKTAALVVDQVRTHLTSIKFPPGSLYHRFKFHLIIVNDGSTDGTYSTLTKFKRFKNVTLLSSSTNRGKGFALRRGFHKARGTAVLIQDADLEYHPKYYQRLLQPLFTGQAQVVYGSRLSRLPLNLHTLRTIKMPLHFIANKLLSRFTNLLYSSHLTDMETGYKLISTGVLDQLHLTSDGFEIEVELTTKILRRGHQILEIPITTKPRNYLEGKKITYTDGIRAVIDLIRYRITPYSLGLIGVMLLAFIMRFWNFTHRYGLWSDQARDVFVGRIALRTLSPPLIGSFSSAGPFTFGPLWYYYSMLTAFLADSHLSYWIGSGLLSLFAIYLLIRLGRSIAGPAMGLTAGLFAAISIENIGSTLASTQHTAVFPTTTASLFFIHRYLKSHRALHLFLPSTCITKPSISFPCFSF